MSPPATPSALTTYAAVVRKEFRQTLRDRRIMFMLIAAPLIQTILFGFAVDFDVDRVPTVVADQDRSPESREQTTQLLATLWDEVVQAVARDRKLAPAHGHLFLVEGAAEGRTGEARFFFPSLAFC